MLQGRMWHLCMETSGQVLYDLFVFLGALGLALCYG
jgi:hypothetical protein